AARGAFLSTLTYHTLKSRGSDCMAGFINRQGGHHGDQKSTSTGPSYSSTSRFQLTSSSNMAELRRTPRADRPSRLFLQRGQIRHDVDEVLGLQLLLQVGGHDRLRRLFHLLDIVAGDLVDDRFGRLERDHVVGLADDD